MIHTSPISYKPRGVGETARPYQILVIDNKSGKPPRRKYKSRLVQNTLSEIRKLQEDLNNALYSNPTERPVIHSPLDAFEILRYFIGNLDHEEMWVMLLDTRNRVMNLVQLYNGSVNSSQIRIGEIFREALLDNALSIIIAHNHPLGDPTPSPDDVGVTRAIVQAGKLLDIPVLDHIIISNDKHVSLKEKGLGFGSEI